MNSKLTLFTPLSICLAIFYFQINPESRDPTGPENINYTIVYVEK